MEPTTFNTNRLLWIVAATGLCASLVAFNQKQEKPQVKAIPQITNLDTVPKKKELKIRNLDEALEDLDQVKIEIDMETVNAELQKIKPEVQKEIAEARIEVEKALKQIDMAEIKEEINAAMEKVDCKEINEEIKAAIDEVNWDQINKELKEVKEINLEKLNVDMEEIKEELKKIKPELEINLEKVKVEIEKAKSELKEYKDFVNGLENDGLINKKEGYTIKHKNGELIINGKTQPAGVYSKYRSFLEKHKALSIEMSDDDFNINLD